MEPTAAQYNLAHLRVKGRSGFFGLRPKIPRSPPLTLRLARLWAAYGWFHWVGLVGLVERDVPTNLGRFSEQSCKETRPMLSGLSGLN